MAFRISGASVRHPIPALVLFAVLLLLGVVGFRALPITIAPNIDIPIVAVTITESGAAPAELETQVTKRIEDAIAGVAGVKHIQSSVTDGSSQTAVEFHLEVNSDRALNDVRDAVAKVRDELPRTIDEPIIERIDVVGQSIQTYAASAPGMTLEQLSWFVDDTVTRALQGIPGVGRVDRIGGITREIRVTLDPDRLAALGITAGDVNSQVRATSVDLAGGRGDVAGQEQTIRTLASASSVAALAATRIVLPGGREVRLSDLGTVTDAAEEPRGFARLDGDRPVVAFAVFRSKGASDVTVARLVAERLKALSAAHPDVSYALIDDSVRSTLGGFESAMQSLAEGAALATLVVLLFLRDWRATLGLGHRPAALHHPGVRRDVADGVLVQLRQFARHHAGHGHPGGRRDRGDREHCPLHPRRRASLQRRHRGGGRDRAGGRCHQPHHRRGVRPRELHGRHRRAVFQAVRADDGRRRAGVAAGRAAAHPGHGGLRPASRSSATRRGKAG